MSDLLSFFAISPRCYGMVDTGTLSVSEIGTPRRILDSLRDRYRRIISGFLGKRGRGRLSLQRRSSSTLSFHAAHCLIIKIVMLVKSKARTFEVVCHIKTYITRVRIIFLSDNHGLLSLYTFFSTTLNDNYSQIRIFSQ